MTWQIPASVLEAENNAALNRRLDAIEAELKNLARSIDALNKTILLSDTNLWSDTDLWPVEAHPEPDIDDGWEPACDLEELPW